MAAWFPPYYWPRCFRFCQKTPAFGSARHDCRGVIVMGFRTRCVSLPWYAIAFSSVLCLPSLSLSKDRDAKPQASVLKSITVFPDKITLEGPRDEQRLL